MALLLNIDTATETGSIALFEGDAVIGTMINNDQKDHAAWIHTAIQALLKNAGRTLRQLNGVAVTAGPGSYTGLRVGMATAKGLCYVLKVPLITESTLKVMARAGIESLSNAGGAWFCPMIDARRMEVFTAVYDEHLNEILPPQPMVLDAQSLLALLEKNRVIFFGSGSNKLKELTRHSNASFADVSYNAGHLAYLANKSFIAGKFTDPAYAEPAYLKEFYTHTPK